MSKLTTGGYSNRRFDVVAVDQATNRVRILATDKSEKDAEAIANMAVMRRGVDLEFFAEVDAGAFKDGDEWKP